jgi:hypothetical protein
VKDIKEENMKNTRNPRKETKGLYQEESDFRKE